MGVLRGIGDNTRCIYASRACGTVSVCDCGEEVDSSMAMWHVTPFDAATFIDSNSTSGGPCCARARLDTVNEDLGDDGLIST